MFAGQDPSPNRRIEVVSTGRVKLKSPVFGEFHFGKAGLVSTSAILIKEETSARAFIPTVASSVA